MFPSHDTTQISINIERKGLEPYQVPCYVNKFMFTNNDAPIKLEDSNRRYNMYDVNNDIAANQNFQAVPECVRKHFLNREEYFVELYRHIQNEETVRQVSLFFTSIDVSNYRAKIFNSNTATLLRDMSKTPFEHVCDVLTGKDGGDGFKTMEERFETRMTKKGTTKFIKVQSLIDDYMAYCKQTNLNHHDTQQTLTKRFALRFNFEKC